MRELKFRAWDKIFKFYVGEDEVVVHMFNGFPDKYEVIGNIHENGELVENFE